jgi:hypothetical protein
MIVAKGDSVSLVDTQDRDSAALAMFGSQCVAGLGDQRGVVEAGPPAERGHDVVVDASGPDGGIGNLDQVVAGGFCAVDGGAGGHGLAYADLTGDHGDASGGDAVAYACNGLGVVSAAEQVARRQRAAEGHGSQTEVRLDFV